MAMVDLDRFTGTGNPDDGIFRAKRYFAYLGFPENDWLSLPFFYLDSRTTPESPVAQSQITTILNLLQKVAIDSATTRVSEEIASSLGDGQSSITNNFEVHLETFDTLIDTNLLLAGKFFFIGDEHSDHADQVFDESSHQVEDSVHEVDMAFDLVADNLVGLQIPLQILISDFDEPIGVDVYVSLIPHDDVLVIAEFFPFIFKQSSLANFGDLAMCESVTDGLPTCHWFDTGKHVSTFIPFVFRLTKYDHYLSATEFDKNGYRPIIGVQGSVILIFAIRCSSYCSSEDDSKIAWEGASHNWFLKMLLCYILAIESGNSKMDQVLDAMSLPGVVLNKPPEETGTVQQFHFKDRACFLISFGGRDCIVLAAHSVHALPMRYFDANSLYSVLSRYKSDFVASRDMYVATIFMKPTILEDLYLHKLFFENKGDVSKREIQSDGDRNDVKHVKFNEGIIHVECLFHVDPGVNLFMVKLGGTVKVVQPIEVVWGFNDNVSLCETFSEERPIFIGIALNLEDKVLNEDGSIVMNGPGSMWEK
ncbi:hypothetical protein KY290_016294 [Solanum tuberosum]|uniref:Uncharacterized protein n=1 Tax=Solanum tuberosum TaxID=4113 RepID=A0ABQ7VV28_SOLTU|nr:hypothetical protein KY285_012837 [Solanum tuberosum]KAH0772313.1 hypothetical protein KY290_016294 [Solanum tuberosum]